MLYDEAVKQLSLAVSRFAGETKVEPSNIDKLNAHILKTQEIITELMVLNMNEGGQLAQYFCRCTFS